MCGDEGQQGDRLEISIDVQAGDDGGLDSGDSHHHRAQGQSWRGATLCLPFCFPLAPLAAGCGSADFPWHCQGACSISRVSPGPCPWSSCCLPTPGSLWPLNHVCPEEGTLRILVPGRCDGRKGSTGCLYQGLEARCPSPSTLSPLERADAPVYRCYAVPAGSSWSVVLSLADSVSGLLGNWILID